MIIFDLDDTLIDTSGSIIPLKMRQCLQYFVERGLFLKDFEAAHQELLENHQKTQSSQEALSLFLKSRRGDPLWLKEAAQIMKSPLPEMSQIALLPSANEILNWLCLNHKLAVVTAGFAPFQHQKMEKAGIDRSVFSKIAVAEDFVKKPFYEGLMKEHNVPSQEVLVCGDRMETDLLPAFELGARTVHVRWGRAKTIPTEKWVDHFIFELSELKRIVTA